jgi:hypothetical protein
VTAATVASAVAVAAVAAAGVSTIPARTCHHVDHDYNAVNLQFFTESLVPSGTFVSEFS